MKTSTENEHEQKSGVKHPRSLFCRRLPIGDSRDAKTYRIQEYITESLLIVLAMIIVLRIVEKNTAFMSGIYGAKYIALNLAIDAVLLAITFFIVRTIYESKVKKFNLYLDANPELRETIEAEEKAERMSESNSCKKKKKEDSTKHSFEESEFVESEPVDVSIVSESESESESDISSNEKLAPKSNRSDEFLSFDEFEASDR